MSDHPRADDWWQTAEGKWYPPQSHPDYQPPQPVGSTAGGPSTGPRRFLSMGLTGTLMGFQIATGVMAALASGFYITTYRIFKSQSSSPSDAFDVANAADGLAAIALLLAIVVFVLIVIWLNQAYDSAASRGATGTTWSSGWAVGGWFIPFANLVIPKLVFNEIDRMSLAELSPEPIGAEWKSKPRTVVGDMWWVLYVAGTIGGFAAGYITDVNGLILVAAIYMVIGVGFFLGAATIRQVGQRLRS